MSALIRHLRASCCVRQPSPGNGREASLFPYASRTVLVVPMRCPTNWRQLGLGGPSKYVTTSENSALLNYASGSGHTATQTVLNRSTCSHATCLMSSPGKARISTSNCWKATRSRCRVRAFWSLGFLTSMDSAATARGWLLFNFPDLLAHSVPRCRQCCRHGQPRPHKMSERRSVRCRARLCWA